MRINIEKKLIRAGLVLMLAASIVAGIILSRNNLDDTDGSQVILMVVVDTLRADHLGCYGYERDTTPNIDALAQGARVYDYALSTSPWTFPAFSSMYTGMLPSHLDIDRDAMILGDEWVTFPEVLQANGYHTVGIVNNAWCSGAVNLNQGYDEFYRFRNERCTEILSKGYEVLESLKARPDKGKLFLLIHFMEPHTSYGAPLPYCYRFDAGYGGSFRETFGEPFVTDVRENKVVLDMTTKRHIVALYDESLAYLDEKLGPFIDAFYERYPSGYVVFTSDHGEEFWEHGGYEHGHSMYDEVLHVPLFIKGPGISDERIEEPYSTSWIAEEIFTLADIRAASWPRRETRNSIVHQSTLYGHEQAAITDGNWRYIIDWETGDEILFNRLTDPAMRLAIFGEKERCAKYRDFLQVLDSYGMENRPRYEMDREDEEEMRSLGYLN